MTVLYILLVLAIVGVTLYLTSNNEEESNTLEQTKPEENSDPVAEEKPSVVVEPTPAKKPAAKKPATRKPAAKKAKFNPNAVDRDGDGIVQEGTPFERPVEEKKSPAKKTTSRRPAAKKPATTTPKAKAAPKKTASKGRGRAPKK